jgi:hypothetical protein
MTDTSDTPTGGPVPLEVRVLDAGSVLEQIVAERDAAARAEARMLQLAVHFVDLHPVTERTPAATWEDQLVLSGEAEPSLAGAGTPGIAEHAVEELGAVLGVSYGEALRLVADSVEVCHRLPRVWELVQSGRFPAWRARAVAHETVPLTREAADFVDRQVAILVARRRFPTTARLRDLVHEAHLLVDPDHEQAVEEVALARRGVWFDHQTSTASAATTSMAATLDAWDALDLDAALQDLAGTMGRLGDTSPVDVRRAGALALLAHPQRVLDLTNGSGSGAAGSADGSADADAAVPARTPAEAQRSPGSIVQLYVHASLADLRALTTGPGAGGAYALTALGPASLGLVQDWLRRSDRVVVRPVIDPSDPDSTATRAVDRHDPPEPMRELVRLRDGACVFPGCQVTARSCDLDHIEPYLDPDEGGPPGQTSPENLACLCRRHHRLKTFTGWAYRRVLGDSYEWTSPRGQILIGSSLRARGPEPRHPRVTR